MRVDELVSSLLRRPLAMLAILAIAAAGAYVGWSRATTTYESSATVLVVPAAQGTAQSGTPNPFTQLDYNIAQLALVVSRQLDSEAVGDQVVEVGGDGNYSADTLSSTNASVAQLTPMISLSATSATADGAQAAVEALVQQAGAQLASVQTASGVAPASQAKVVTSSAPVAGTPVGNPKIRAAGVLGIAAGCAALLLAVVTTPLLARRKRRDNAADQADERDADPIDVFDEVSVPTAPTTTRVPAQPAAPQQPAPLDRRQREAMIRQLVREDWERSGSNVAWTKAQQRAAFDRATRRLDELEQQHADAPDNVAHLDDYANRRNG